MHWLHHVGVWCDTISSGPPFNVILQRLSYFSLGRLDLARYASKIPSWVWINIFWSHPGRPSKPLITIFTTQQLPILHHLVENKIFKDIPMSMLMSCHAASAGVCNCHWSLQQFLTFLPLNFFALLSISWDKIWPNFKWIGSSTLSCGNFFTSYIRRPPPSDLTIIEPNFDPICRICRIPKLWCLLKRPKNHPLHIS